MKFKDLEEIVLDTLRRNINTQYSDNILYIEVIYKLKPELRGINFKYLFVNYISYKIPSFKTVERIRRKLEKDGRYIAPKSIKLERDKKINEYLDYAMERGD